MQMQNPQYEILKADGDGESPGEPTTTRCIPGRIVPIYEKTGTLTTKMQRAIVHQALSALPATILDPLPADVARDSN